MPPRASAATEIPSWESSPWPCCPHCTLQEALHLVEGVSGQSQAGLEARLSLRQLHPNYTPGIAEKLPKA